MLMNDKGWCFLEARGPKYQNPLATPKEWTPWFYTQDPICRCNKHNTDPNDNTGNRYNDNNYDNNDRHYNTRMIFVAIE